MIYQDLNSGDWYEPRKDGSDAVRMVKVRKPITFHDLETGVTSYYDEDDETWKPVDIKDLKSPSVIRGIVYTLDPRKLSYYVD